MLVELGLKDTQSVNAGAITISRAFYVYLGLIWPGGGGGCVVGWLCSFPHYRIEHLGMGSGFRERGA